MRTRIKFIFTLCTLLCTAAVLAQTFPAASSCTSKDLELVRAELNNGDACGSCTPNTQVTNRHLIGYINNKTGSTRTSFAFWGTLVLTDPDGTEHTSQITGCNGPIPKNATTGIDFGPVTYTCGQSLKIINLYLAWTDASPGAKCPLNSATINPKCGILPSIIVVAGLNADITKTDATCDAGGIINVSPYGGTAPYSVTVNGVTKSVSAGGTATFTGLPSSTTPYTIYITDATLPTHCTNNTHTRTITSSSAPDVSGIGGAFTKTCTQNTSGATIGESPVSGYGYSWSPTTGLSDPNIANPNANPSSTTTYTVIKTNTTTHCSSQASVTVTVDQTLPSVSGIAGGFTKNCTQNLSGATIGETPVNGYSYSWTPSTGLSDASIGNPIANPSSTTTYQVTKTNSSSGCTAQASVTVTVNKTQPSVSGIGGSFTKTCAQNASGATIGETPVSGFSYSWSPSTGLSNANVGNPTANPSSTTTYTVTKTDNANGCSNTAQVTVTVNTTAPTFTVCLVQPTLCANSGSVTIFASGGSGFQYSIDNGAHFQSGNSFTALASGSVSGVIVTNSDGCTSSTAPCDVASDCSQQNVTTRQTNLASDRIATNDIAVKTYPNPFNDRVKFVVNAPLSGDGSLEVYNIMGQKIKTVYQGRINAGDNSFELTISKKQQATLFYVFRVGDKKVTGKLLQINN